MTQREDGKGPFIESLNPCPKCGWSAQFCGCGGPLVLTGAAAEKARGIIERRRGVAAMDDYTMDLRLCDDDGMVSHEQKPDCIPPKTYLDALNMLRRHTKPFGEHKPVTEPFLCTGSAHLAGEHIRCTSPAHVAVDTVISDEWVTGTNINGWQVLTAGPA